MVYDTQGDDPAGRGCGRRQGRSDGEEIDVEPDEEDLTFYSTVRVDSLPHRKWKEIKQQPSMLPGPAVPGCCFSFFPFPVGHPLHPPCTSQYMVFPYEWKTYLRLIVNKHLQGLKNNHHAVKYFKRMKFGCLPIAESPMGQMGRVKVVSEESKFCETRFKSRRTRPCTGWLARFHNGN